MGFRYRARKTLRLGPLRLHFTERGYTGWGLKVGPWTWSARTGQHSINTPGWGGFRTTGRRRRR